MTDDLSAPLGQNAPRKQRFRLPVTAPQAIAAALGLFLAVFLGFALFNTNPFGGEPMARIAYDPAALPGEKPQVAPVKQAPSSTPVTAPSAARTVTIIDGSSGQRREMPIGANNDQAAGEPAAEPAPALAGINPKLLENSRYGMVPIAADGLKPFRAYAGGSDLLRARAAAMPSIAIVVTGLGVGAAKTNDAIMKLPAAVTLAFTPYGSDPGKLVGQARAQKHEVLLQVPMEPFDYPDNDPGPQTLLTTLPADQNLDRLLWHMSRFQGYVGLANFMGSRFVVTDTALQPIIKEAAKRGLGYLDDGSAPRSVAGSVAYAQAMPFAKADATIDAVPTAAEIDRTLAKLEGIAREHGTAVGVASALPVSIERIGAWARQLEGRGLLLVPLTTAMMKPKSS
ncbi:MAG: divergent polysaccharide deacetylase family protein [Bradyrhizobiaceae bacterium]|nr:MAG: divergent polysaccharide deacetylase family protein [Bradyrhizobiaceae bacterium]